MPVFDRNKKELGVGDEVVVQFRVSELGETRVTLETVHNQEKNQGVVETIQPLVIFVESFRTILQRKAPTPKPAGPAPATQESTPTA